MGSVICYKLYKQYKRKLAGDGGQSKKRRRRWTDCEAQDNEDEETDAEKIKNIHVIQNSKTQACIPCN